MPVTEWDSLTRPVARKKDRTRQMVW